MVPSRNQFAKWLRRGRYKSVMQITALRILPVAGGGTSGAGCEQIAILAVPVALEALVWIVLPLEAQELGKLRIGRRHLRAVRPAVIGQIVAAAMLQATVDQAAEIFRRLGQAGLVMQDM